MTVKKKKITLVGPVHPYRGGIAHFTETLARGLQARGHTVPVVSFARQYPALFFPGATQFETEPPADASISAERIIDSVNPLSWWRAARAISRDAPDAVVFQHWMPFFGPAYGTMARLLRRERKEKIRTLALVHNALPHERRVGDRLLSRYFFGACDGFVVMSEAVERDLRSLGVRQEVRRVLHPVYERFGEAEAKSAARDVLGLPAEAPVLLFFGLIRAYKGLRTLLEAMPRVVEERPDVRLVVAGEFYDDMAPYRGLIRQHHLENHVLVRSGYVPNEDVARYFSAADVVVQPYVRATQSGVAQVAFHFDRPLIVTDVGGLPEIVPHEKAGLVVPPEDPPALAAAIERFFADGLQARLTEGVKEQKERAASVLYEAIEAMA